MKKLISLGAAAAVLSLTAVAASAAIAPSFVGDAVTGETITVEVVANGMTQDATTFTVKASENLTLVDSAATTVGFASYSATTGIFAWANSAPAADGTVLLTLTYTVDAAADEEVSVAIVAADGFTDIDAAAVVAIVTDGAAEEVPDETAEETAEETVEETEEECEETEEIGLDETEEAAETEEAPADDNNGGNKGNPDTGVALGIVPAVLAGASIIVSKKRK